MVWAVARVAVATAGGMAEVLAVAERVEARAAAARGAARKGAEG